MMLSMLSSGGAAAGASTSVQPQTDAVPPPAAPPALDTGASAGIPTPPIPVIAVWVAEIGVAIWIATRHHKHVVFPNSPA
jgi:hypothetical protein